MKKLLLGGMFLWPFWGIGQALDTVGAGRAIDSLIQLSRKLINDQKLESAFDVNAAAEILVSRTVGLEHARYGSICFNYGRISFFKGKYQDAANWYLKSLTVREKALGKEHIDYANSLNNTGLSYEALGDYTKAEVYWKEALSVRQRVLGEKHPDYAISLNNLGVLYERIGNYSKAEPYFLKALAIRGSILDNGHPDYALSLNNLGDLYTQMGNYEKAEYYFLQALLIYETKLNQHPDYIFCLDNLGALYSAMGSYRKAEPYFLKTLEINEKKGENSPDYANSLSNLGALYNAMGDYQKSEFFLRKALSINEKVLGNEHRYYASIAGCLGALYIVLGEYEKAIFFSKTALSVQGKVLGKHHPDYANSLNNLGDICKAMGYYAAAEGYYIEALSIQERAFGKKHPEYAKGLYNLANLYRATGNYAAAATNYIEFTSINQLMLLKSATHLSESELNNYVHTFSNNFDQILSFTQTEVDQAFRLVPLSYSNVLFNKGFLLNASCQVRRLALSDSTSSMKYYMLKGYNNSLAAEYSLPIAERDSAMLVDLEEKANSLEKDLVRTVAGLGDVLRQITWQEVRDILQPNEAAIEFVHYRYYNSKNQITDSTMYAALLLLHGDTIPHFIPLCEERQLEALLPVGSAMDDLSMTKLRAISIQQLYASSSMAGRPALYNLLWSAIDKTLVKFGIKTVYFAPSGVLHRLNLEALTWDKSGRTLADQYHLVQLGSTRELAFNAASKDNRPSSAVIYGGVQYAMDSTAIARAIKDLALVVQGNPGGFIRNSFQDNRQNNTRGGEAVYGYTWKYLKSTEEEAHFLYDLLDRQHVFASLHIGYSATEESVKRIGAKAPSPGLIHIGTHGFFFADPKDPVNKLTFGTVSNKSTFMISDHPLIRSGLLFAGAQYAWDHNNPISGMEDGILTALEVSQMNLSNTQLVVLSACETGLGDIKGNEGVYGLQRAFRIAGAKNVLMSLWQVSDDATQKLMTCFYNKWLVEKQPLRAAFEAAQQWLRGEEGYGNPYYWAGFVLVGEL